MTISDAAISDALARRPVVVVVLVLVLVLGTRITMPNPADPGGAVIASRCRHRLAVPSSPRGAAIASRKARAMEMEMDPILSRESRVAGQLRNLPRRNGRRGAR